MEQKTEQSLEEDVGFLLTHPFQNVQAVVRSLVAPPIPNTQMELHRDSNQPRRRKIKGKIRLSDPLHISQITIDYRLCLWAPKTIDFILH